MKLVFIFTFIVCALSTSIPNKEGKCGPSGKVYTSETLIDSTRIDESQLFFVSENNQIIVLRTQDGQVYLSSDEGKTFEKQTVNSLMSPIEDSTYGISRIFPMEYKDGKIAIYFLGGSNDGKLWVSEGTNSYTYSDTLPTDVTIIILHPLFLGSALARRRNGNTHELFRGTENGKNWKKLIGNLPPNTKTYWSRFPDTSPNRIYLLKYEDENSKDQYDGQIIYSDDWFQTINTVQLDNVYDWRILFPNKFIALTCSDQKSCGKRQLHISEDAGKTFHTAFFPETSKETPDEKNFYVYEFTDDAIWINIQRECFEDLCWGDMFHSTSSDRDFTLALQYLRRRDFTKFQSVEGIYIANQYITEGEVPQQGDNERTLITFNKGSEWNVIKPPLRNANNQPTTCNITEGCSLHMHGWDANEDYFTYYYSISNAIGLMIATGNLGKNVDRHRDSINTYISWDGGVTWEEIRKGAWVPEIGDHGSIITLVDQISPTNELIYTINNGDEWRTCQFTDQIMDVSNIRIAKGFDSRRFLLYGQRNINGSTKAVLVHLNFDNEFSGKCTEADFEIWTPKDVHGYCVMGKSTDYTRRKRGKDCYYGEDHEIKTTEEPCPCTKEDYECDHCFYRPDLQSPCVLECSVANIPPSPANCSPNAYYEVNIGYRKLEGDKCTEKVEGNSKPKGLVPCRQIS